MKRAFQSCAYAAMALTCMATSPVLPEPQSLKGSWILVEPLSKAQCGVMLLAGDSSQPNQKAVADASCAAMGLQGIGQWWPLPGGGIILASADSSFTPLVFDHDGKGNYSVHMQGKPAFNLHREIK